MINNSSQAVAFKVKTTAPLRFVVKPVFGFVSPDGGDITVKLQLHPLIGPDGEEIESDQGPFDRSRQKFLVEWAYVYDADINNPSAIVS